jgi:hypothetical protein
MNGVSLATHGDSEEQVRWPALQPRFSLYEPFWTQHVYTLRGTDGRIRADIDERLELMAEEHYSGGTLQVFFVVTLRSTATTSTRMSWG